MEIPERVSWRVVDAWLALPPCTSSSPYCHHQCPYFAECYPEETESEDDEAWDEYYEQMKSKQQD